MPVSNQTPRDVASEYATIAFVVQQLISGIATCTLVRVVSCTNDGEVSPVGTVNLQPLVNMMTGDRQSIPHGVLNKALYIRWQAGSNAMIMDPQPNDIGVAVFASRDISAVKTAKAQANPGSARMFDMADGIYLGGVLNGAPAQFIQFTEAGVTIKSPTAITLEAPTINLTGAVVQTAGDVTVAQDMTVTGTVTGQVDVVAGTISGKTHTHPDGTPNTGPPSP